MRRSYGRTASAIIGAVIAAAVALAGTTTTADAQGYCKAGAFIQRDMAGVYASSYHQMRVEIYSCGGSYVRWDNQYGTHEAVYYSAGRLTGGGIAAMRADVGFEALDATSRIGYKPAEPGFIQVFTVTDYGEARGVYRLQKIGPEPSY